MTDVAAAPEQTTDPDMISGVSQYLAPVVINLTALALEGKQAHWHVRGSNFQAVHELLDTLVDHAREYSDQAAEPAAREVQAERLVQLNTAPAHNLPREDRII